MKGFIDSSLEGVHGETKGEKRESNTTFETADLVDEFQWCSASADQEERPPNPLENASPLSRLLFLWTPALFRPKGENGIHEQDLPEIVANKDGSEANLKHFQDLWNEEKSRASHALANRKANEGGGTAWSSKKNFSPSLKNALSSDGIRNSKRVQPFLFLSSASKLLQALSLGLLLQSFEDDDDGNGQYYFWAGLLVLSSLLLVLSHHQVFHENSQIGMRLRASVISALYDKSLLLKSGIIDGSCNTDVLSLAANDAERYILAANYGMYKFWSPITAIGALSIGCFVVGWPFAVGFFVLVFMLVPAQLFLIKCFCSKRSGVAAITDMRIGLVSQFVEEAKVWKMMDFTSLFLDQMTSIRSCEINRILHINRYRAMNEALFFVATVVTAIVVFLVQVCSGHELSTLSVFTTLSLVNVLFLETKYMTWGVMGMGDAAVSSRRIQKFLSVENLSSEFDPIPRDDKAHSISLSHVTAHWQGSQNTSEDNEKASCSPSVVALDDVTLDIGAGLNIVIGGCGSGKSALLHLLAKELPTSSGAYRRKDGASIAYFPQQPWLFAGTVYENILFGLPYDEVRYREVIQTSCLASDLEYMEEGDETPVGERGLNLSGGQRARVALARTLYRDADIILLDDPLAAVDSKVANDIYKSIKNVAKNKCVVLVTHQLRHITDELCILMNEGRVLCVGSLSTVSDASGGKIAADVAGGGSSSKGTDTEESPVQPVVSTSDPTKVSTVSKPALNDSTKVSNKNTFKNYCGAAGGIGPGLLLVFLFTASQTSMIATIRMAGWWATVDDQTDSKVVSTVVTITLAVILFSVARALYYYRCVITASKVLHDRMSRSVVLAAASFFDTNTTGNILNRFSADTGSNDDVLPNTLYEVIMIMFMTIGVLVATALVLPVSLVTVPALALGVYRLRDAFIAASRQLKGLEMHARSPILSALNESLCGIMTIRANDASELFHRRFFDAHDAHTRAYFASMSVVRWFGFYMDLIMWAYITVISVSAALIHDQDWATFSPQDIGISLVLSVQLGSIFGYGVRQSAEAENLFLSVQRVLDYCGLSSEAPLSTAEDNGIASDWPTVGAIEVKDLSVRYREGKPLSLKALTFQVDGGTRVGVVGRTGSGKSTLLNSIVRLLEAESGQITIDGIDIATLGLSRLRNSISVISQTPVLHGGISLRRNLDPSQTHKDDEIREALLCSSMLDVVDALPSGLDTVVNDEGATSCFSAGERQLLTLSRSLLEKKKILVLDEATANIDNYTETKIQQVVSELQGCTGCTILSIAHRLDTIIDHDKVLVLGNGSMLEFGSPHQLIEEKGAFFDMVQETGNGEALAARAKRSSDKLEFNRARAHRLLTVK